MICRKCGAQLNRGVKECPLCGEPAPKENYEGITVQPPQIVKPKKKKNTASVKNNALWFVAGVLCASLIFTLIWQATGAKIEKSDSSMQSRPQKEEISKTEDYTYNDDEDDNEEPISHEENTAIFDSDGIKITYMGFEAEKGYSEPALYFCIENNTQKDIYIDIDTLTVNGFAVSDYFSEDLSAGNKANCTLDIHSYNTEVNNIKSVGEVKLSFGIYDGYEKICSTPAFTAALDENYVPELIDRSEFSPIAENNGVSLYYSGMESDEDTRSISLKLYLENNSDKAVRFSLSDVYVDNFKISTYDIGKCPSDSRTFIEIYISADDAKLNGFSSPQKLVFNFYCSDDDRNEMIENKDYTVQI